MVSPITLLLPPYALSPATVPSRCLPTPQPEAVPNTCPVVQLSPPRVFSIHLQWSTVPMSPCLLPRLKTHYLRTVPSRLNTRHQSSRGGAEYVPGGSTSCSSAEHVPGGSTSCSHTPSSSQPTSSSPHLLFSLVAVDRRPILGSFLYLLPAQHLLQPSRQTSRRFDYVKA
jgi:hypothetical protein